MIGILLPAMVGCQINQLLKYRACAWYKPSSTCASVPMNTSTSPKDRRTTVSFSELKKFRTRSIIFTWRRLHEIQKSLLLAFRDLLVTHHFIKPSPVCGGDNRRDHSRFLAGF